MTPTTKEAYQRQENWMPIVGYPHYEVSNMGRVRSLPRVMEYTTGKGDLRRLPITGGVLRPSIRRGLAAHPQVTLSRDGCRSKQILVHLLVLETFVGPRPAGTVARHFPDRDPTNNWIENLSWGSPAQNQADRITHGTDHRGQKAPSAKLSEADVIEIRRLYRPGRYHRGKLTRKQIAARKGISKAAVDFILSGRNWGHLQ